MKLLFLKNIPFIILLTVMPGCSYVFDDKINDYLKETESEALAIPEENAARPIVDFYPLPQGALKENVLSYEIPMPQQVFSSGTTNEVRLHKLGEVRWIYVETLPSSTWPLMKDYWNSNEYGLSSEDPSTGIIESNIVLVNEQETKFIMKIEHGIRQASSEIFISHVSKNLDDDWIRLSGENNLEEKVFLSSLDFLSNSSSAGGTSLVALNLNIGQKAILKQNEDLTNFIELNLEFPRAWAAVDRALKEALIKVNDLDRKEGIFYVSFSRDEDKGFIRRMFSRENPSAGDFKVVIVEESENKCIVTVGADTEESKVFERDLLSEINQSLS